MKESRGRPSINDTPILKYTQVFEDEDGGKETAKVESKGKVDINSKLDNLFD